MIFLESGVKMTKKKKKKIISDIPLSELLILVEMINKTDESSASKCYETINRIKDLWGEED